MEKSRHFEQPIEDKPQKMTKARLHGLLEELNLDYSIEGEGNNFNIIIQLPEKHIQEKQKLEQGSVLNEAIESSFDKENFYPLFQAIKRSTNFDCEMINTDDKSKYIISVFKK